MIEPAVERSPEHRSGTALVIAVSEATLSFDTACCPSVARRYLALTVINPPSSSAVNCRPLLPQTCTRSRCTGSGSEDSRNRLDALRKNCRLFVKHASAALIL